MEKEVKKIANSFGGPSDLFLSTLDDLERKKHEIGRSKPNDQQLDEIRRILHNCAKWSAALEKDVNKCVNAVQASMPPPPVPVLPSVAAGQAQGGDRSHKKKKKKKGKDTRIGGVPKVVKINHLDRFPEPQDLVAAIVDENWILTTVVSSNDITGYIDVMDEEDNKNARYTMQRSHVVLLPHGRKEAQPKYYPKNGRVFAMYPDTTTFYPALVLENTRKDHEGNLCCSLAFEEDEDEHGNITPKDVPLRFITIVPAIYGAGKES